MSLKLFPLLIILPFWLAACGGEEPEQVTAATQSETSPEQVGHGDEDGHEEENGHIALTPDQIKASGIQLVRAGPAQIKETLPLYGVIAPNAERTLEVTARFPGVIQSVSKRIGDSVRRGEALASVEANESLQAYAVTAPLSGVVIARNANPGEHAGDKPLFTVADLSTVWVELSLFPRDVAKVRVGQSVRVNSKDAGLAAEGKVVYVAPFGHAANQTLTARVLLENPDRRWAPGLYITAHVTLAEIEAPLAIRNEAVQTLEGHSVVFVQDEEGFEPRKIRLGRSDDQYSEVLSGVAVGDTYVAANSFILKAEQGKGEAEHGH